ncbi:MAG: hypothetical protein AB7I35_08675 [Ramlibacter sp.]
MAEYENEGGELPLYIALGDLARYIASLERRGTEDELQEIFEAVERWHTEGDEYVKEAATIGLLEDLQNASVVGDADPSRFTRYLGPESKHWWVKVDTFWKKGEIIRDSKRHV